MIFKTTMSFVNNFLFNLKYLRSLASIVLVREFSILNFSNNLSQFSINSWDYGGRIDVIRHPENSIPERWINLSFSTHSCIFFFLPVHSCHISSRSISLLNKLHLPSFSPPPSSFSLSLSAHEALSFVRSPFLRVGSKFRDKIRDSASGGDRWAKGEIAFGAATRGRREEESASLREAQISSIMIPGG